VRILICCATILYVASFANLSDSVAQSSTQSLIVAVKQFQTFWGVDVSYASTTLLDRSTKWTQSTADNPESDLADLLDGTGVTYFRHPSGTFFLHPQEIYTSTVVGRIQSEQTGSPLRGAHISLDGTSIGTISDLNGQFILSAPATPSTKIRISHIGYLTQNPILDLMADSIYTLNVFLTEWVIEQRPVEVTATAIPNHFDILISERPYQMDIRGSEQLRQVVGLGTPDIVRNLSDIAGLYIDVSTSDIHIQGSGLGEHQFKLDGSIVYEPIHLGLFGIFNPLAIETVTVRKAGFHAEYGSYLAGIISAEHSLTSDKALEVQLDPISFNARAASKMNLGNSHLSLVGAFRTSIWDHWWSNLRSESVNDLLREWNRPDQFLMVASIYPLKRVFQQGYNNLVSRLQPISAPTLPNIDFNDIHAAVKLELAGGDEIGASIYTGNSDFQGQLQTAPIDSEPRIVPPDRHSWTNRSVRLYFDQTLSDRLNWRMSWRKGEYFFSHNYGGLDRQNSVHAAFNLYRYNSIETSDENGLSNNDLDLSLRYDHGWGRFQTGVNFSWVQHHFRILHVFPRVLDHERNSHISSGYLQQIFTPTPWAEITSGLRLTRLHISRDWHLEPRFALLFRSLYQDGYGVSLRLSTGIYHQFLNQFEVATISPSSIVPSTRFWLPVDETLSAPRSHHYSIDLSAQLWTHWQLGLEYYHKIQRNLYQIDYPKLWSQEVDSTTITRIDQFVTQTNGLIYGTSIELRYLREHLDFALRFERSESTREYTFRGQEPTSLPVPWNVPQQFQVKAMWTPIPAIEGMIRWHGAWGRKWAYKRAYYDLLGSDIEYAAQFDDYSFEDPTAKGHRLASFSQLDLGIAVIARNSFVRSFQIRLDLLNALGRQNPAYQYLVERPEIGSDRTVLADETSYLIGRSFTLSLQLQW